ncbi:MAG TPA: hypothetical protein VN765_03475 [Candidatus Acidoferrum sp.]|nr:hypothetical protein [Candidatus Acidoferrum sp.]
MSVDQIEKTLLQLPPEQRRQFADWFYQHEHEIVESQQEIELSPDIKAGILRRRDEVDARPERLEPWEGTTERVRARLHEVRHQKTQTR